MNILRSGPFPRKSSGACLFLLGLLGLSSTVLVQRKQAVILSHWLEITATREQHKWRARCPTEIKALPFLHKARTAVVFPTIPVLLGAKNMLLEMEILLGELESAAKLVLCCESIPE